MFLQLAIKAALLAGRVFENFYLSLKGIEILWLRAISEWQKSHPEGKAQGSLEAHSQFLNSLMKKLIEEYT